MVGRRKIPESRIPNHHSPQALAGVDRTTDGKVHRRHVLHDWMGHSRRLVLLPVRIADAEEQIVAKRESEVAGDIIQIRVHIEDVRVVANQE